MERVKPIRTPPNSPHGSGRTVVYTPEMALCYVWTSFNRLKQFMNLQMPETLIDNEITLLDQRIKNLKLSMEHDEQNRLRNTLLTLRNVRGRGRNRSADSAD